MAQSSSRERRQQKTRQSILDAARQIILENGPAELSMRSLAERIDYSPSGLYEYFNGKEDIIHAVCDEGHSRLAAQMRLVDESLPPEEYLVQIGLGYIDFAAANPELFQLMFSHLPGNPEQAEEMLSDSSSYSVLQRAIQRGIAAGVFKTHSGFGLQEIAFTAWAQVHGMSMLLLYVRDIQPGVKREALSALARGLASP
jgi:AcrR family transcriptional regulator